VSQNGIVMVIVENADQGVASVTFELLEVGRRIAYDLKGTLCGVVVGHGIADISHEIAYFVDEVYCVDHALLASFQAEAYTSALEQLCRRMNPDIVLMGHILNNLDLAPRLAYRIGAQPITDCINVAIESKTGHLLCTKPVYGGNAIATFKIERKPRVATLRSKVVEPIERSPTKGKVISFDPAIEGSLAKTELIEIVTEEGVSLDKADAIVAGGRGIKNLEGLKQLEELAKVLERYFGRVELGASRPLVDANLLPSSRQIGLTGEKVAPELYIAVGISGASQHLTGILGSKKIIAVNSDPKAPIFGSADYGVIGNYEDIVPALRKKLEELL